MAGIRILALFMLTMAAGCAGDGGSLGLNSGFGFRDTGRVPKDESVKILSEQERKKEIADLRELAKSHADEAEREIAGRR